MNAFPKFRAPKSDISESRCRPSGNVVCNNHRIDFANNAIYKVSTKQVALPLLTSILISPNYVTYIFCQFQIFFCVNINSFKFTYFVYIWTSPYSAPIFF